MPGVSPQTTYKNHFQVDCRQKCRGKKNLTFPGVSLNEHKVTKDVLHRTKNAMREGNIDELDFIEVKYLSSLTTPVRVQKQDTELIKSLVIHPSDKGLIARMPKNYCKSIGKG